MKKIFSNILWFLLLILSVIMTIVLFVANDYIFAMLLLIISILIIIYLIYKFRLFR